MGDWSRRRVLVTGATGIVGSWFVKRLLAEGAYVVALVRDWDPQSELIRSGDIRKTSVISGHLEDYGTVSRAINDHETDCVFHLGAQTIVGTAHRNPLPTFEANIRGTYNVLEACRVHSGLVKSVVIASSDKAYGDGDVQPYTEVMPPLGRHPYDVSKSCTDLLAQSYGHTYELPVLIARCGNIYGGGDLNWSRIVPGTIRSLIEGQHPVLRSDGSLVRDYLYVKDAAAAYLRLGEAASNGLRGEAFNFGLERQVTVLDITRMIQRLMNRADLDPIILNNAAGEIRHQSLNSGKARRMLDWQPQFTLEQGLAETIDWYRSFYGRASQ